ncbi:protocadherin-16-like [Cyprinus carpio]|uniref:Protocadherin-16-like n=2 Tax=Cyprinus carpio TaxID=7962 RepID=A0A8C1Q5Q5_CYPCA|nr:protocadherin-16-like [Cyprinus carpio]XP_018935898.1 protocadherin-16-like [Cyprinus carpio]
MQDKTKIPNLSEQSLSLFKMKTIVIVFLVVSVCIQCATPSKLHIRKKRAWIVDSLSMEEEHTGPFPYKLGDLNIEKKVIEEYSIHGQGIDKDPKGILSVNRNGSVYAHGKVDFEEYRKLRITLSKKHTIVAVDIDIMDVNDHAPVFNRDVYEITVDESTPQGKPLVTVLATDNDQPGTANAQFTLRIASVSPSTSTAQFFIQQRKGERTGTISLKGFLDYEQTQKYTILVEAKDHGEKMQLSSTSTVILNLIGKHKHQAQLAERTFVQKDAGDSSVFKKIMKQVGVMERKETGPMLDANKLAMCLSEETADITAFSPDLYSPPLHFELIGDVQGKWRLQSNYGASVRLIKESAVRAGDHEVTLKISDSQGQHSVQTLSLHVCDCDVSADCTVLRNPATKLNVTAIAAIIISILVLQGVLLMACRIRIKKPTKGPVPFVEGQDQFLCSDVKEMR